MSSWDVAAATPTKALRAPLLDASDQDLGPATPTQPAPATAGSMDDLATKLSRFRLSVRGLQTMVARGASAASLEAAVDSAALESAAILAEFSRGLAPDAARADRGKRNKLRRDFQKEDAAFREFRRALKQPTSWKAPPEAAAAARTDDAAAPLGIEQGGPGSMDGAPQMLVTEGDLLAEREAEFLALNHEVQAVSSVFRDLGTIVTEQQADFDDIESLTTATHDHARGGRDQVLKASGHQKSISKCALYMFTTVFVLTVVLVLLFHPWTDINKGS